MIRRAALLLVFALLAAPPAGAAEAASVSFVVVDGDGHAVAGAEVGVWSADDWVYAATDAEGKARLADVAPGDWVAYAAAEARTGEESEVSLAAGEAKEVRFVLGPGVAFSGRVVGGDGEPVADAYVEAIAGGSFEGYGEWKSRAPYDRVYSGRDGSFRIRGIPPGAVSTLVVRSEGFREGRVAVRAQAGKVRPSPLEIVLDRGGVVRGTVLDPDGKPVPGADVFVVPADDPDLRANPHVRKWSTDGETKLAIAVRAGEGGRFEVGGLALDEAVVALAEADGFARSAESPVLVPSADRRVLDVELRLRRTATLVVRVTDPDGKPLEKGICRLGEPLGGLPEKSAPDEPGLYRFEGLPPGKIAWWILGTGYRPAEGEVALAEGETKEIEVRIDAGATIAGLVRDRAGKPVEGVRVRLERKETEADGSWRSFSSGTATTDADGRFRIGGLAAGRHDLSAVRPGEYATLEPVPVDAPKSDLVVTVDRLGTLRVEFETPSGGPALPDRVMVWRHHPDGSAGGSFADLEDGVLLLRGFEGKKERVDVRFEEFVPFTREVEVALGKDLDLGTVRLDAGVTLRGKVVDPEGRGVGAARLAAGEEFTPWREASTEEDGSFALAHVPAGDVGLTVSADGFLPLEANVKAGADAGPATLRLARGAVVAGRLVDGEGNPLADHWIQFRRPPTTPDDEKGRFLDETGTEEDGSFEIRVPAGPCRILFVTDGTITVLAELDLEEGGHRDVGLTLRR